MSKFQLISENASVVVVGSLNPAIIQPAWLAKFGVITEQEAQTAEISIIIPDVSSFRAGPLVVEAQRNRLKLETADPGRWVLLPGQINRVLELLEHTPLTALGINRVVHYQAPSLAAWHGVGDRLTPKSVWDGYLEGAGMRALTIEGKRPGSTAKHVQIQVAPSNQLATGIMLSFNEHFDLSDTDAGAYGELLGENWQDAQDFFRKLEPHVLDAPPRSDG